MKWAIVTAILVGAIAGGLRFFKLGEWSYSHDELATYQEIESLMEGKEYEDAQTNKLPRLVPIPYVLQYYSMKQFGRSEWSARVSAAVFGTLLVVACVLIGWHAHGGWLATSLGLIVALNAESLFQSQNHRFYSHACFFAGLAAIVGYLGLAKRSVLMICITCVSIALGMLCHTLLGGLFGLVFVGILITPGLKETRKSMLIAELSLTILAICGAVIFLFPQLQGGWNSTENWGYSSIRAVQGAISQLGWPVACLAVLGWLLAVWNGWEGSRYWTLWSLAWVGSVILLPMKIKYHPAYSLPFAIGPFVFAAYFTGEVASMLNSRPIAIIWMGMASCLNLPSVASHYADGSRFDYRAASAYLVKHRKNHTPIYALSSGFLREYEPEKLADARHILNGELLGKLEELRSKNNSTYLVLTRNRGGYDTKVQSWLNENAQLVHTIRHSRFDYYEYAIDIFMMQSK